MVNQGEIIKINLNPKKGHEQRGYRPYICLSHEVVSEISNIAIFAPISNTERDYPFYISLENTTTTGKVLLDQLVAVDYNAREYVSVEVINDDLLNELLMKVKAIFQKNY